MLNISFASKIIYVQFIMQKTLKTGLVIVNWKDFIT